MTQERERLTARQVADLFRTSVATIRSWAKTEKIPAHTMPSGRLVFFLDEVAPLVPGAEQEQHAVGGAA